MGKFANAIKQKVIREGRRLVERRVIKNYREFLVNKPAGHALLSYLVAPLLPPSFLRDKVMFSNRGIAQEIPRALNELGFIVDIVNATNKHWLPAHGYDIFIGHGGTNYEQISKSLSGATCQIYFSTGLYWKEWNIRVARRIYELSLRRGYTLPAYRAIIDDEEYANDTADGIICLGNRFATQTYSRFAHVIGINNAIFPLSWGGWKEKDYESCRKHFLFFSGRGHIHKGLDLILEAFAQTDLHLHVCQHMESDFLKIYRGELSRATNIHLYGLIEMRSPAFEKLALSCDWVISATCVEGQPGALLECMGYGLLPIMPEAANIDVDPQWGTLLPSCDVQTIRQLALQLSEMSCDEIRRRTEALVAATRSLYSSENFLNSFKQAISDILTVHKK